MSKIIAYYKNIRGKKKIWRKGIDFLCDICAHLENTQVSKDGTITSLVRVCRKETNLILGGRYVCPNYITKSGVWKYDK